MIPKIVHITWKNKDILQTESPIVVHGIKKLIELNPDWDVQFSDDEQIETYLKQNLSKSDYNLISPTHIIQKTDIWRLIKMYIEGGLYIDLDRLYNIPLKNIIDENVTCVLPTCLDHGFSQDIMLSAPENPIFLHTLYLNLSRRMQGINNTYFLGPQTFMHAVTKLLTGEMIDLNPPIEVFEELRKEINKYSFMKTFRENPPYNTLVYQGNFEGDHELEKRKLYAQFDLKHWTGEW